MLNFTVGPVKLNETIRQIGGEQVPYFRTAEFSKIMLENEQLIKKFVHAGEEARALFLTGSGTASMEAAVMNTLTEQDRALVVNGGGFGERFVELCRIHSVPCTEIKLETGEILTEEMLRPYESKGYTAFLVNAHETSTGVLYDLEMISRFCKRNGLFLIVDAISSFLADPLDMEEWGIDVAITGSQKAISCPPGVSIVVLSKEALERVERNDSRCMYFDLKRALKDGERGQTPFTPAVGVLLQIHARLLEIEANGGVEAERRKIQALAEDFRSQIRGLPFEIASESMSNTLTPLKPLTASAYDIFTILKNEYEIWICPNGGVLEDVLFRVGHIGALTIEDNHRLISALWDMKKRKLI